MKIAIDMLPFNECLAGTGVYIRNLLKYFGKIAPEHEFHLFINSRSKDNFQYDYDNYFIHEYVLDNKMKRIVFEQIKFIYELNKFKIDVLFVPSVVKPILYNKSTVISILDMIPYKVKAKYPLIRRQYIKYMGYFSALTSKKIITISHSSKKDICDIYKINSDKIIVTYLGLDREKLYKDKNRIFEKDILSKYGILMPYILYVGTIEPGKNLENTMKAFKKVKKDMKDSHIQLVLCGKKTKYYKKLKNVTQFGLTSNDIVFTDFIPDGELSVLYKHAELFIYISFYEGFGLPILEAMGNEIPVVTSNISSMPEVVGLNGCVVDPNDINDISKKCKELISNKELRKSVIKGQNKQLEKFSWELCAKETLKVILKEG